MKISFEGTTLDNITMQMRSFLASPQVTGATVAIEPMAPMAKEDLKELAAPAAKPKKKKAEPMVEVLDTEIKKAVTLPDVMNAARSELANNGDDGRAAIETWLASKDLGAVRELEGKQELMNEFVESFGVKAN